MSRAAYRIEHRCPQCGAPIVLGESDHLLTCPYCKVRLYLSFDSYPKYHLPANHSDEIIFIPYWRSRGIEYSVRTGGIRQSVIDRTWNASRYSFFPSSLGIRPQTLKLRLFEADEKRILLPALSPADEVPPDPVSSLIGLGIPAERDPLFFRTVLKDSFSLIYLPAFMKGEIICDAVDSAPFGLAPEGFPNDEDTDHAGSSRYYFIPALCPNCGNDLAGEKESLIVFCQNCMVGFYESNTVLREIPFSIARGGRKTACLLPFWKIRVVTEGLPLPATTGRMLPGGRRENFKSDTFSFWVPAFRINPQLFLRLAHRATMAQLEIEPVPAVAGLSSVQPVTISPSEAVESLKLLLVLLVPRDHNLLLRLNEISIETKEIDPVLIPFDEAAHELTNRHIQVAVHRNALRYGRNL